MININDYDYFLPKSHIANKPATPRDHSKLLVYDTATDVISHDRFINLNKYLPKKSFLVLNNTKVIPARITLYKSNSGKVEILFLVNELSNFQLPIFNFQSNSNFKNLNIKNSLKIKNLKLKIRGYVDRKINVGDRFYFDPFHYVNVIKQEGAIFTFEYNFSKEKLFDLLKKRGTMPIPLYIKNTPFDEHRLRQKYQTIFANVTGSSAAPTASLHFTNRIFKKLDKADIKRFFITLHVGLGTFAPINEKNIQEKKLHEEYYDVSSETFRYIDISKSKKYKLVAVGTTVARTLESIKNSEFKVHNLELNSKFKILNSEFHSEFSILNSKLSGKTDLFIFPPYNFQMVDCLITNFHLPKSSLMMLVEAFLQYKGAKHSLIDLYKNAIDKNYRFYSFGDAMFIK